MRDTPAGSPRDGEAAADIERPIGRPRPWCAPRADGPGRRLVWARMAMALVMVAQLVVGVITPLVHARAQSSIGSHLETQGARRHYIHDDGSCAVCAARHVVAVVAPLPPALPLSRSRAVIARPVSEEVHPQARRTPSAPRAPPTSSRIV